jgi:hypothetical protein
MMTIDKFSIINSTIGPGKGALAMSIVFTEHALVDTAVLSSAQLEHHGAWQHVAKASKTTRKKRPMQSFHSNRQNKNQ